MRRFQAALLAAAASLLLLPLHAQDVSATLTGIVSDSSGAVIPGAQVTVTNETNGIARKTITNGEGFFTVTALQPSNYTVAVTAPGFNSWEQKGVTLNAGDKRTLSNITMAVGAATETVTITGAAATITPVDSGEKSDVLTEHEIQNVATLGRNAAELVKIMPGFAMNGGVVNQASFNGETQSVGGGPAGSFSGNGTRQAAINVTSDGADVLDPGCNCGQSVTMNDDMTQEVKVMTSNFGADVQKGPIIVSGVGKSGTRDFHGEAYLSFRDYVMNANDAQNNAAGLGADGKPLAPRPQTKYIYPGGNIGGPVIIPGTGFNHNRDKLFFFFGYEYYYQQVDNGIYRSFVPTDEMRKGNFSQAYLNSYLGSSNPGYAVTGAPNFPGGIVPPDQIQPLGLALMNLYPAPNANPQTNNGFNFIQTGTRPANAYQLRPRVDWSISDNTKLFVSYNRERQTNEWDDTLWWRPDPTVPYPGGGLIEKNQSDSISANLTRVFTPSLTNEFIFTWTRLNLPNYFKNPEKESPAALGLGDFQTLFKVPGVYGKEIPSITGWSDGVANLIQPSGFETGSLFALKPLPTFADNLSKVWGTHTMKFGFYAERTENKQPASNNSAGELIFSNWGGNTTGNAYADMLTGRVTQYTESNGDPIYHMAFTNAEFYAQDSWKISRRLTFDYGMRFSHLGGWQDLAGNGLTTWVPSLYDPNVSSALLPGVEWHSRNKSYPLSGTPTRAFFYEPRVGFAYDIFGTGRTVLRGGYGMYRFHDEQNVQAGADALSQPCPPYPHCFSITTPNAVTYAQIPTLSASFAAPGLNVVDPKDDQQPRTQSYSFTISQRMPWSSLGEVSYVGTKSDYLSDWNNNLYNLNFLPYGALWANNYSYFFNNGVYNQNPNANPLRPYPTYGTIKLTNHQMYSNYNALQASWNKQAGRVNFLVNYTFSKSLGIRGEGGAGGNEGDPVNIKNDYGVLPNDRTHVFNIAYIISLGSPVKNAFLGQVVNGWQVSGITQFQSGPNLQAVGSANFNLGPGNNLTPFVTPNGTIPAGVPLNASLITGSPDYTVQPILTCDPRKGLASGQYINGSCFAAPTIGHNGAFIFPYIHGPAFYNNDLSLFKDFRISEQKKIQFRISGYNFLNHPLPSFENADPHLNIGNPQFGYTSTYVGHRIMQLAFKFYF